MTSEKMVELALARRWGKKIDPIFTDGIGKGKKLVEYCYWVSVVYNFSVSVHFRMTNYA